MVEVDFKIVLTGIVALTVIYLTLILTGRDSELISGMIISIIALAIGVIIPSPRIDNKTGKIGYTRGDFIW